MNETSNAVLNAERSRETSGESSSRAEKPVERAAEKPAATEPARRDERPATSTARESRPATEAGRAELVAQLNEVTRELATLRATNARLTAGRGTPTSPGSSSSAGSRADDKLNAALRSYAQFRQELGSLVADTEKLRAENAALAAQVKELKAKSDHNAAAAVVRLEKELQAERAARAEAERQVAGLRDQLRAVARAVSAAGVTPETSGSRTSGR